METPALDPGPLLNACAFAWALGSKRPTASGNDGGGGRSHSRETGGARSSKIVTPQCVLRKRKGALE